MADRGKGKPDGGKTEDAHRTPGMMVPFRKLRIRAPALTKAELRAQGDQALAMATKAVVKLPTKIVRQCGLCGESHHPVEAKGQRNRSKHRSSTAAPLP